MARNRRKLTREQKIERTRSALVMKLRGNWRLALAVLCVVLITGSLVEAANMLSATPHFTLAVAEIVGTDRLDADEVADRCGLIPGLTNTFAVDPEKVREACLTDERIAWVEVRKFLPDRVRVTVREARPAILVRTDLDLVSYDGLGHPLYALPPDWIPGLPVLTGLEKQMVPIVVPAPVAENREQKEIRLEAEDSANARRLARVEEIVLKALELYSTMEAADSAWLENGATIAWNAAAGFDLEMPGRPRLVFGLDNFRQKAARINISLSAVALRGVDYEAINLANEIEPGAVLLREKVSPEGASGATAVTQKVEFE